MAKLFGILFVSALLICLTISYVDCAGTYAILAPKIIRPRAEYNVIVSLHNIESATQIKCELKRNAAISTDANSKEITFDSKNTFQIFKLAIGLDWSEGQYNLTVTGSGGLNFIQLIQVEYVYKQFVIMIQSDKAIYKPGQIVLFRVVILDDVLRPVNIKDIQDMKLYIIDPLDNKLRVFLLNTGEVSLDPSIYGTNKFNYSRGISNDLSFQLHSSVQPGAWKIQAVTRGQVQNYTFFVDYYTLPLANVTLTLPDFVTFDNPVLDYQIDSFYTFGKPVNGTIDITISKVTNCNDNLDTKDDFKITKAINGQIIGKLNLQDTRLLNPKCSEMRLNVTAVVNDKVTESIYSNFEVFDIYKHDLKVEQIDPIKKFKPGKVIRQQIQVHSHSGQDISEIIMNKLVCKATFKTSKSANYIQAIPITIARQKSEIICDFQTEITYVEFNSTIIDELTETILYTTSYPPLTGCSTAYIQVLLQEPTKKLVVGDTTNLVVRSNEQMEELIYYIVIRGSIVNASTVTYKEPSETLELPISLTREMVPEAIVAVFMSSPQSGVIVSDSIVLSVTGLFHNEVNFSVVTPTVDAGQKASVIISAESDSTLFLLGVDEAVLALKQGNDLTEKRLLRDLTYNYANRNNPIGFMQSGMDFRTNGIKECENSYFDMDTFDPDNEGVQNKNNDPNSIRKDFRETWIWDKVQIPHEKKRIGISKKVPDSITSWRLTAFALHDEKGLGLTRVPGHVTVFRPFFIKLNLPYSIRREEESEIHIMVFNYLNQTANIGVKVYLNDTKKEKDLTVKNCTFNLKLEPNNIKTLTCSVKAHQVGTFDIIAEANANVGSENTKHFDGELRQLLVIYEGVVQSDSKTVYFDLTEVTQLEDKVSIVYPEGKIEGSESVFMSATAELVTTTWKDELESMVNKGNSNFDFSMPTACCQQRVVGYFPKVYWLDFLKKSKKGTEADFTRATAVIQKTVDLLCFQNPNDGSFVYFESAEFGWMNNIIKANSVKSSVWQTAYTIKLLNHAKKYVSVDNNIIKRAINWIKKQQLASGEFIETDPEHTLISTTNINAYLTAYVYIALNTDGKNEVNPTAETYLARVFPTLTDPLDIVITCYAINIAQHTDRDVCYKKVIDISKDDKENKIKFWVNLKGKLDLQISAYGLMLLNLRKSYTISLEVYKFISSHQDSRGSFSYGGWETDSLVTILCTEAMTQYVTSLDQYDPKIENMFLDFNANNTKQTLHIKPDNEIVQAVEAPPGAKEIKIVANGYGRAISTVYWQWNIKETNSNSFNITAKKRQRSGDNYIYLDFCTSYNLDKIAKNAMMEIDLPSGYLYDGSKPFQKSDVIDKIEPKNSGTHLNIYLKKITDSEYCVSIPCVQSFKVTNSKPVPLMVYPNYDRSLMTVATYHVDQI